MLQAEILAEIFAPFKPILGSYFSERLVFEPPPHAEEIVPAVEYIKPTKLLEAIEQTASYWKTSDLRVAASMWNKHYNNAVLPGVLAYMTLTGVGLDAALDNASIVVCDRHPQALLLHSLDGTVIYKPRYPAPLPTDFTGELLSNVNDLHRAVFVNLFQSHLALAIDRVHALTKLSKKIMWGNAGNLCVFLYEKFAECLGTEAAQRDDRVALLEQRESFAMPRFNPLYKPVRYEKVASPDLPPMAIVRRTCCLAYLIPNLTACSDCPRLTTEERIELLKQEMEE